MNFFCTWKQCLQPATNRFCEVTLFESNRHVDEIWLCPVHWSKARWSGRMDLKESFLEALALTPPLPEVVYERPDSWDTTPARRQIQSRPSPRW